MAVVWGVWNKQYVENKVDRVNIKGTALYLLYLLKFFKNWWVTDGVRSLTNFGV